MTKKEAIKLWGRKTNADAYEFGYYIGLYFGHGAREHLWQYATEKELEDQEMGIVDAIGDWPANT